MRSKTRLKDPYFIYTFLIILGIIYVALSNYYEWWELHFRIGPFFIHHWFSITGASFITVYTPTYHILKQRIPKKYKLLSKIHIFGNLLAVMLISVHFGHHMHRPWEILPDLRSGIAMYLSVVLLIATGMLQRFQIRTSLRTLWRQMHISATVVFYLVIIVHLLQRFGVIGYRLFN